MYLRLAALGDSTTYGIGDPVPGGWRGWARLLAGALATSYDVSSCNVAVSGATATSVRAEQLDTALAHRPDVASLVVGINDTMRSAWDPARVRDDLMTCADALHGSGALLLTARFHDHGSVFGLPGVLRRPLAERIETVNRVYDEIHATYAGDANTAAGQSSAVTVTVKKATARVTLGLPRSAKPGARVRANVAIATVNGIPATGKVVLKGGGKTLGSAKLVKGRATVVFKAPKKGGKLKVQAVYAGDSTYSSGKSSVKVLTVTKPRKKHR
ncbi:GDSL-type esterase/lipase family protein [Nocardioides hankookensis]